MPQQEQKKKQRQKKWQVKAQIRGFVNWFNSKLKRSTFAYLFMFSFIILTSIGVGLIFPPAGLVVAGVSCGIFGFILGLE